MLNEFLESKGFFLLISESEYPLDFKVSSFFLEKKNSIQVLFYVAYVISVVIVTHFKDPTMSFNNNKKKEVPFHSHTFILFLFQTPIYFSSLVKNEQVNNAGLQSVKEANSQYEVLLLLYVNSLDGFKYPIDTSRSVC